MRKTIFILSVITVIGFTGCSSADIEKNPIVIADAASLDAKDKSETSEDITKNDEEVVTPEVTDTVDATAENTKEEETDNTSTPADPAPVTIEIEGMKETMYGLWHTGNAYRIMYDVDRFEFSDKDGSDTFVAENPDPAIYPYVYVSIHHIENKTSAAYIKELSDTLSKNSLKSEITSDVSIGNYKGTKISAKAGTEWNSIIRNYYIIEDGTSIYTIESQYFLEAAEGYGARIHAMLNTFEIMQ